MRIAHGVSVHCARDSHPAVRPSRPGSAHSRELPFCSAATLEVLRALVRALDDAPPQTPSSPGVASSPSVSAPPAGEATPTDESLWASTPAPPSAFPTLRQATSDVAEAVLRGSLRTGSSASPATEAPASLPRTPHAGDRHGGPAANSGGSGSMPLPLPLSPVNSPDGEKVASPGGDVAMQAGAETDGDSPLVMPRRAPGAAFRSRVIMDSDSEDAGFGSENQGDGAYCKPHGVEGAERTPLAEMPLAPGSGGEDEDEDEEGLPTASPGPEVVDLSVASPGHAPEGNADAAADDDSPLVVPTRRRGGMRRMVIVDSDDDDVAASEPLESPPAAPAAPPQPAPSPEVLTIADTSDSDTSPLVAPPRRRGVIVIDSDTDESSPAPAVVTRPAAAAVDVIASDPFALGTPSPGGSVANLPSPSPSPAWVAPRTGVKGGRTPGPAAPPGTARKPPATPGGMTGAQFVRQRDALMRTCFGELNAAVFGGQLPASLADTLVWNAKLKTTAGVTYTSRQAGLHPGDAPQMLARIELSTHVIDSPPKLRQTLCHELCHAAAWLLDGSSKPPHGPAFWKWARKAMDALPGLDVTTCHSYDIAFKFNYACTTAWCAQQYGRHSDSINTGKQACGVCGGALKLLPRLKADGTPVAKRAPTAFSLFVKERFAGVKAAMPMGTKHADVMKELSALWRQQRAQEGVAATGAEADEVDNAMRALDLTVD